MNGSETLMDARSWLRGQAFMQTSLLAWNSRSWLRLRAAAGRRTRRCGSGLTLLIALALAALSLAATLAVLALAILGLTILGLAVLALHIPAASLLARGEIGARRLLFFADDDFCTIGQVGKAGRHHTIGRRQPAGDDRIVLVLLRHHDRFGGYDIIVTNHVAESSPLTALRPRRQYHERLPQRIDPEPHVDELHRPELLSDVAKLGPYLW